MQQNLKGELVEKTSPTFILQVKKMPPKILVELGDVVIETGGEVGKIWLIKSNLFLYWNVIAPFIDLFYLMNKMRLSVHLLSLILVMR